jgi:general secretion pathway protein D
MRKFLGLVLMMILPTVQAAETEPRASRSTDGVSLVQLLERSAARLNKRFIVDPRLTGEAIMVGIDPERITYRELQAVLSVHGFMTTQEANGTIEIIPDANARQLAMPVLTARSNPVGEDEVVTKMIDVGPLQATQLVPILRPLLPQYAHLVGESQTNSLIVVARYENVRQIETIVNEMKKRPTVPAAAPKPASGSN